MVSLILSIVAVVLSICFGALCWHLSVVYHTFNENVKEWTENLDNSTAIAIDRSARKILRELDQKITENNNVQTDFACGEDA